MGALAAVWDKAKWVIVGIACLWALRGPEVVFDVLRLMTINAEQRELIEALTERNAVLSRRIAELTADLRTLKGENARPERGCHIAEVRCDEARVLIEYGYTPAEEAVMDLESPRCGPGHPEVIEPIRAFINGYWCDLQDVLAALSDDVLVQRIGEGREEVPA